jgi:carbamoyltransferase
MRIKHVQQHTPSHPLAGKIAENLAFPLIRAVGSTLKFYDCYSRYALQKGQEMRERLNRGESVYILGMGPSGHNSTAALVKTSAEEGIIPICNNEEERYTGIRHEDRFPEYSLREIFMYLEKSQIDPDQILAVVGSWDYLRGIATSLRVGVEEFPYSILLARRAASPQMNPWHFVEALQAPSQLKRYFGTKKRVPFIGMRHHDNHAYFPYAVSPFAKTEQPTMIVVIDGFGDDGAMSTYIARGKDIKLVKRYPHIFDSLGLLYAVISSTQGGWTTLSSEGRFMGATAWGDTDRLTNPFYKQLRQILFLGPDGEVGVNRSLINYQRRGQEKPYNKALKRILGEPIPPEKMWNPGTVLKIDDIKLTEISQKRVDKAAALQMVFEDALFHIVDSLIQHTKSHQLVLSGGTSLNCLANMKLLDHFDENYYKKHLKTPQTRLHLWVPPNPSDTGAGMGACYHFALRFGADLGPPMTHAFFCGNPFPMATAERAIETAEDTKSLELGNIHDAEDRDKIADLVAYIVSQDGILGLFQGASETGPRALGHRTILANPCNPKTLKILNSQVKFRENFRPLAPMLTLEEAKRLYDLSDGASDDNFNAYNYMVLTVKAKPEAYGLVPAVIHKDGTSRIQIVREETDSFSFAILKAMGRRQGMEVAVNTSLNVGTPIVQTPEQAINALHRSRGMTGLLLVGSNGKVHLVWHNVFKPPKDSGYQLKKWIRQWRMNRVESSRAKEQEMRFI